WDKAQHAHRVRAPSGKDGIQLTDGLMWDPGLPFDEDVWSAHDYVETTFSDTECFSIIDARGKSIDGKCWRVLAHVFETASYRNVPEEDTALLDRVLDGACVEATQVKSRQRR